MDCTQPYGENTYNNILSTADVLQIRATYAPNKITYAALGEEYGVHWGTIASIIHHRSWRHL